MGVRLHLSPSLVVDIEDIPLEVASEVAAEVDRSWWEVLDAPLAGDGRAAVLLLRKLAAQHGVEPPVVTVRTFDQVFERYDGDTRPTTYQDGLPEVEGEPTTG